MTGMGRFSPLFYGKKDQQLPFTDSDGLYDFPSSDGKGNYLLVNSRKTTSSRRKERKSSKSGNWKFTGRICGRVGEERPRKSNKEKHVLMNYYYNDTNLIKLSLLSLPVLPSFHSLSPPQVPRLPRIGTEEAVEVQRNWTFLGRSTATRTILTTTTDRTVHQSTAVRGKVRSDGQCSATWPVVPRPPRASCRQRSCRAVMLIIIIISHWAINVSRKCSSGRWKLELITLTNFAFLRAISPADYAASPTKTTCITYSNENTRITCDSGEEIEEVLKVNQSCGMNANWWTWKMRRKFFSLS